jgi:GNAT superfamily N-acetyltransferase
VSVRLELLTRAHRPLAAGFESDEPELVTYLRRWALRHQEQDGLGRTWVAVDEVDGEQRLSGFFTLAAASLERQLVTVGALDRLPRFPIPAVLLARLAVDRRVQGQGLGTWLFDEALRKTLLLASEGPIGLRVLVTDAKNERAADFYERRGLVRLTEGRWPCRMVLDLRPLVTRA